MKKQLNTQKSKKNNQSHKGSSQGQRKQGTSGRSGKGLQQQQLAQNEGSSRSQGTGLPSDLKKGIEQLSGFAMGDVRVHYNSPKPSELGAFAYARGSQVHLAPGQEKRLPHEAWHIVQQKKGDVSPTKVVNGIPINDDPSLEQEAEEMGTKVSNEKPGEGQSGELKNVAAPDDAPVQCFDGEKQGNTDRRDAAKQETGVDMKLDHIVSQESLKEFFKNLSSLESNFLPKACKFTESKSAFQTLLATAGSARDLINIRANIVPGYLDTIGDPNNIFDPHIVMEDNVAMESGISDDCYNLDRALRIFDSMYRKIPNQTQIMKDEFYDGELDNSFAEILGEIDNILTDLDNTAAPKFDNDTWYPYNGSMVKKMPGIYEDNVPGELGSQRHQYPDWTQQSIDLDWEKGGENGDPVKIYQVEIPSRVLKHVYDRHTIEGFAGTIEPRNSFFPDSGMVTEFLNEENADFKDDMELIVDRLVKTQSLTESAENADIGGMFCSKGFYHGHISSYINDYNDIFLNIKLDTIAPQDSGSTIVLTPDLLQTFVTNHPQRFTN